MNLYGHRISSLARTGRHLHVSLHVKKQEDGSFLTLCLFKKGLLGFILRSFGPLCGRGYFFFSPLHRMAMEAVRPVVFQERKAERQRFAYHVNHTHISTGLVSQQPGTKVHFLRIVT